MTASQPRAARLPFSRSRCGRELCLVWRGGWGRLRSRLGLIALVAVVGVGLVWFGDDADKALLDQVHTENIQVTETARFITDHSDLVLCVPLSLILWGMGAMCRRARWRRLGLACLMAALIAGLIVQVIKRIPGRPRPDVTGDYPGIFCGPTSRAKLHSFPSGHTATSTATGMSLVAAAPIVAIPGAIYAASVGWSRMQLRKHYPLDVAVGGFVGFVCGACFASTVPGSRIKLSRKKRRHRPTQK